MTTDHFGARFTVIEQIGGGNYGTLFRVIDGEASQLSERIIATKKLKDAINHPHVLREVSVQRHAQRCTRHVAKLLHVVPRDQVRAALVLEYVPLDLRVFLNTFYCDRVVSAAPTWCATENSEGKVRGLPPTHVPLVYVRSMVRGLLEALQCLHARGIAHRDVKPENILVEPLGLDHPLRCVCPPLPTAQTESTTAASAAPSIAKTAASSSNSPNSALEEVAVQSRECCRCCWVHARRPMAAAANGVAEHDGVVKGEEAAVTAHDDRTLEPCRAFHGGTVQLHHELTGDDLARALHLLHCSSCRRAAALKTSEDAATALEEQNKPRVGDSAEQRMDRTGHSVSNKKEAEKAEEEEDEEEGSLRQTSLLRDGLTAVTTAEEATAASPLPSKSCTTSAAERFPLTPDVKLCDFGSARHIGTLRLRSATEQREELTPGPTTPVYCAPEMMLLQQYGTPVDMWAVGVILFEMLTGEFFLSVGTLRSFYGDLVVHDDYCVMHRLNMMFRHLGTPSAEEWRRIAHPSYYPVAMLPHLPQLPRAALFSALPPSYRVQHASKDSSTGAARGSDATETNEEGITATDSSDGSPQCPLTVEDEESAQKVQLTGRMAPAPSAFDVEKTEKENDGRASNTDGDAINDDGDDDSTVPDLSRFLLHHIGACGLDFLRSLLRYNPEDRLTAAEALRHPFLNSSSNPRRNDAWGNEG